MQSVIDTATDMTPFIDALRHAGVRTVIRYYNHQNGPALPAKRITPAEARALADAGHSLAVVFQQRGGAGGAIGDLTGAAGARDAARALELAAALGQPEGSAIYFAVDHDYFRESELAAITPYFEAVRQALGRRFRTGVYGSGTVGGRMLDRGLADLVWLAGATGWSGTRAMLGTDRWALFQQDIDRTGPGFRYDGNIVSPAFADFGQFRPGEAAAPAGGPAPELAEAPAAARGLPLMVVIARSGLKVRRGPGTGFDELRTLPRGTLVTALGRNGDWVQVDLEGDGAADGFMHGSFLGPVAGGFPAPAAPGARPLDVARAELALGVAELPGAAHNPRILLYHATTTLAARDDETAWCSSFVNYCVEQAGLRGTRSAGARSWHDRGWGQDVTAAPEPGDIAVFGRTGGGARPGSGHVGFWLADAGTHVRLLGGNQGNRISVEGYPKDGIKGSFTYRLLSIRRP